MSLFFAGFALLWSVCICIIYYRLGLGYIWPLSLLTEVWPYLVLVPLGGWIFQIAKPTLRKHYSLLGMATLLLLLNFYPVYNWYGLPIGQRAPNGLRVMTYNIWIYNQNYSAILNSIQKADPDILLLTEVSPAAMSILEERLNYPYSYRTSGGNNALFSRYPVLESTSDLLGVDAPGRTYNLVARLEIEGKPITLIGVHPPIPALRKYFHVRNRQLDALAQYVQLVDTPVIALGDFNTSPWSPYMRQFEAKAGVKNAGRRQGIFATWYYHSNIPKSLLKTPIDHIETRGLKVNRTWIGDPGGSDHCPITTSFQLT